MKKWFAIFSVILCMVFLAACGGQATIDDNSGSVAHEQGNEEQGIVDSEEKIWVGIAHISINPQFDLYLDEKLHIVEVDCLNADAQAAFAGADVLGQTLFDGLFILLDQAQGMGYVKDGMEMVASIELDLPLDWKDLQQLASDVEAQLQTAVNQLKDIRGISLNMDCSAEITEKPEKEETPPSEETAPQDPDQQRTNQKEYGKDIAVSEGADGVTVLHLTDNENRKVTQHINADGGIIYQRIEDESQVFEHTFDENGILREEEIRGNNGFWSVSKYDAAGDLVWEEIQQPDGFHSVREYASDGTVISEDVYDPNQSAPGQEEIIIDFDSEGNQMTTWHNSQGWLMREEVIMTDGQSYQTEYQYDENGERVWSLLTFSNGTTVETTYQNGKRHIETTHDATNGYVQVFTYNENDVRISAISDGPDGFYSYQYFDDNGVLVRWDLQDFFGRDSHRTYNPDGSYTDRVYEPEVGKTLVIEYDANGNEISYAEE